MPIERSIPLAVRVPLYFLAILSVGFCLCRPVDAARSFAASGGDNLSVANYHVPEDKGSVSVWFYPNWAQTDNTAHVMVSSVKDGSNSFMIVKYDDNILYGGWVVGGASRRLLLYSYSIVQSGWNNITLAWDVSGTGSVCLWLNGTGKGCSSVADGVYDTSGQPLVIGGRTDASTNFDGYIGEVAIWHSCLEDNGGPGYSTRGLAMGIPPNRVRPDSIQDYWPLWGIHTSEPSMTGSAALLTVTGATRAPIGPPMVASLTGLIRR